jgi:hypothetical protein
MSMAAKQVTDEFGNRTTTVWVPYVEGSAEGRWCPVPVPWEECQCGYLPREDRDYCTKHGTNAKLQPQSEPEPETQTQPQRVVSVARTRPLYEATAGSSALDKIEDIVNRAIMEGEFTIQQRGIMRWAIRKCRSIMTKLRGEFESL